MGEVENYVSGTFGAIGWVSTFFLHQIRLAEYFSNQARPNIITEYTLALSATLLIHHGRPGSPETVLVGYRGTWVEVDPWWACLGSYALI